MAFWPVTKRPVDQWLDKVWEVMVKMTWWLCWLTCALILSTEEQEESIYNLYISEVRNIRLRLESCEERLIRQIRTPMERDDVHENVLRISEQEVILSGRLFCLGKVLFKNKYIQTFECKPGRFVAYLERSQIFSLCLWAKICWSMATPLVSLYICFSSIFFNSAIIKDAKEGRLVLIVMCRVYIRLM